MAIICAARRWLPVRTTAIVETFERELMPPRLPAGAELTSKARWLGVSRITMKAKLVQFGLHPGQERGDET